MMNIVMAGNVDNSIFVEERNARLFPIRSNLEMSGNRRNILINCMILF